MSEFIMSPTGPLEGPTTVLRSPLPITPAPKAYKRNLHMLHKRNHLTFKVHHYIYRLGFLLLIAEDFLVGIHI